MKRIDNKNIPDKKEVRLFIVGIDSAHLIPYTFKHYFNLGFDRIFYIDNNSEDNSLEVLSKFDKVHVWLQKEKFTTKKAIEWRQKLMDKYGVDNWCLVADIDECFIYPDYEKKSIKEFVKEQEIEGYDCVRARLIEMYSDKKVKDTKIKGSLLETCPYYDKSKFGCNKRVLGMNLIYSKRPLVHYSKKMKIEPGYHNVHGCKKVSPVRCGLLHFKFISKFGNYFKKHGNKMTDASYKLQKYKDIEEINFFDKKYSFKYKGSEILKQIT